MVPLILLSNSKCTVARWQGGDRHVHRVASVPPPAGVRVHFFHGRRLDLHHTKASERFGNLWWLTGARHCGVSAESQHAHGIGGQQTVYVWSCIRRGGTVPKHGPKAALVRQISEASYWLYLTHLPVVMVLQHVFAQTGLDPILKFSLITFMSTVGLYLPWQYFFKGTIVGRLLIGGPNEPLRVPQVVKNRTSLCFGLCSYK